LLLVIVKVNFPKKYFFPIIIKTFTLNSRIWVYTQCKVDEVMAVKTSILTFFMHPALQSF